MIIENVLKRYRRKWTPENSNRNHNLLQLNFDYSCDHKCTYCYINNVGKKYTKDIYSESSILKNVEIIINWLNENSYSPSLCLFGGELLMKDYSYNVIQYIIENKVQKNFFISIPTAVSFIFDEKRKQKVFDLIELGKKNNVDIKLSASIDGKYMDNNNRPLRNGNMYTDDFYHELFKSHKYLHYGLHPMIYFNGIECSIQNHLWFMEMLLQYNIDITNLSYLEVRNAGWKKEHLIHYIKFLKFLMEYGLNNSGNGEKYAEKLIRDVDTISKIFIEHMSGLTCSAQSVHQIGVIDLKTYPCHRLKYDKFLLYEYETDGKTLTGIKEKNVELFLAMNAMKIHNIPYCEKCLIKHFCSFGCLGSQYETTGNMFLPIPSVCRLYHVKVFTILRFLHKNDVLKFLMPQLDVNKNRSIVFYEREGLL